MTTLEFFKELLEKGSIEKVIQDKNISKKDVEGYFNGVFKLLDSQNFNIKDDSKTYKLFTDGASKGNPGQSGIGIAIILNDEIIEEISENIGITTNNIAEYTAMMKGIKRLIELGIKKVEAFSDSELLVKQINGIYSVKNENLKKLHRQILSLIKNFDSFTLKHIPREENQLADKLSKKGSLNHSI